MEYFNDPSKRIVELCENLITNGIIPNERTFCLDIGYEQAVFNQVKNGVRGFPKHRIPIICEVYNVRFDYIVKGILPVFNSDGVVRKPIEKDADTPVIFHKVRSQGVPFYDIDVSASIVSSFSDVKELPEYFIDFKPFNDCMAWMPIYGDSMYPKFQSGEIVAIKQIMSLDVLQWGEPHLVITDQTYGLRTVKCIHPHEDFEDKIILRSTNPNYRGDTIIPKKNILSMYIIKGKVTRFQI